MTAGMTPKISIIVGQAKQAPKELEPEQRPKIIQVLHLKFDLNISISERMIMDTNNRITANSEDFMLILVHSGRPLHPPLILYL